MNARQHEQTVKLYQWSLNAGSEKSFNNAMKVFLVYSGISSWFLWKINCFWTGQISEIWEAVTIS